MKKFILLILMPVFFQLHAQNSSLSLSGVFTYYNVHFYKDHSIIFQPGFDIRYNFPINKKAKYFTGIEFGYYSGGLKHTSNDITYDLRAGTWHVAIPFYRRYMTSEKWHPRVGFIINIPLSTTYTYNIYDSDQNVYQNTDKPAKEHFNDIIQVQTGFEYRIAKQWWLDFQVYLMGNFQISTGIKYYFLAQTKK